MSFERELLNERFDVSEDDAWYVISVYWYISQHDRHVSIFGLRKQDITDIRRIEKWKGDYDGIEIEIDFLKDGDKLIWFGVTHVGKGESPFSRQEHVLGYIEVRHARISADIPVDVRIVCCWKPVYLLFQEMADALFSHFKQRPIDQAIKEILDFKALVERQTYQDIFSRDGKPQENMARGLLQSFLAKRSYREVPVRGGQSDILVLDEQGRFLYETKIWKGKEYFTQGLREIEEYIIGEDSDDQLVGVFYVVFDDTKSAAAHNYRGSDLTTEIIANRTVHIIIVNINPPQPSKKPKGR